MIHPRPTAAVPSTESLGPRGRRRPRDATAGGASPPASRSPPPSSSSANLLRGDAHGAFYPVRCSGRGRPGSRSPAILGVGVVSRMVSRGEPAARLALRRAPRRARRSRVARRDGDVGLLDLGVTPTAAAAAGAVLMPVAAIRGTRVPLADRVRDRRRRSRRRHSCRRATAGHYTVVGLAVAASAVLPLLLAVVAISGFRRLVRRELDLALVQSTVSTPRLGGRHAGLRRTRAARLRRRDAARRRRLGTHRDPAPLRRRRARGGRSPPGCGCTSSRAAPRPGCTTRSPNRRT